MPNSTSKKIKVTEITKTKSRVEEEKFYVKFSENQLNAVLLLILGNTFFVQGVTTLFDELRVSDLQIKAWFTILTLTLFFLIVSVGSIIMGGIISSLKSKRFFNLTSFVTFIVGLLFFLSSLVYLVILLY